MTEEQKNQPDQSSETGQTDIKTIIAASYDAEDAPTIEVNPEVMQEPVQMAENSPLSLTEGMQIADYTLIEPIGSGGMGDVWRAACPHVDGPVALKILKNEVLAMSPDVIDRFVREGTMSKRLSHKNIVITYDAGSEGEIHYIATEFIPGKDVLSALENDGAFQEKEALEICLRVSEALCYAWNNCSIIHRDIKPANIMLDLDGEPKLMDMGLAKSLGDDAVALTMTGVMLGTPFYMSPEQAKAEKNIDFRSDIYELGSTLYHMLTGRHSVGGETIMKILENVISETPPSPRRYNPNISDECILLIEKMMSKDLDKRHRSWEEAIRDIKLVIQGKPPRGFATQKGDEAEKQPEPSEGRRKTFLGIPFWK